MRRGFSTIVSGALILLLFSIVATIYLVYIDSNQYKISEAGRAAWRDLRRESESLHVYIDGDSIVVRNTGSVPVQIKYLVYKDGGILKFQNLNISLDIGEDYVIVNPPSLSQDVLIISDRGKAYSISQNISTLNYNSTIFKWVNESLFRLNIPYSELDGIYVLENSIMVLNSSKYGYIVLDLLQSRVLYNGPLFIIPTRDGDILYSLGNVYVNGTLIISGPYRLLYVGFNYLMIGDLSSIYAILSNGSVYTFTPVNGDLITLVFNGEYVIVVQYMGKLGAYYQYLLTYIEPLNFSIKDNKYLSLPVKLRNWPYTNIYMPNSAPLYLSNYSGVERLLAFFSYPVGIKNVFKILDTSLAYVNNTYTWGVDGWYLNIDGEVKYSNVGFIQDLSTLSYGVPMMWSAYVSVGKAPYYDADVSVYNLSILNGRVSLSFANQQYYVGTPQEGVHTYQFVFKSSSEFLKIQVEIVFNNNQLNVNVSVYSLYPREELLYTQVFDRAFLTIDVDLYFGNSMGRGVINIYNERLSSAYLNSSYFEFSKDVGNIMLEVYNITNVSTTVNYQYSEVFVKLFIFDDYDISTSIDTLDYLFDRVINFDTIYPTFKYNIVGRSFSSTISHANHSISIPVLIGSSIEFIQSAYAIDTYYLTITTLSTIDTIGLYLLDGEGIRIYNLSRQGHPTSIYTYNLLYVSISPYFGGVELYVNRY